MTIDTTKATGNLAGEHVTVLAHDEKYAKTLLGVLSIDEYEGWHYTFRVNGVFYDGLAKAVRAYDKL